jgi:hypothetical protein
MAAVRTFEVVSSTKGHEGKCGKQNTKRMNPENACSSGAYFSNFVRTVLCYKEATKNVSPTACRKYRAGYMMLANAFPVTSIANIKTVLGSQFYHHAFPEPPPANRDLNLHDRRRKRGYVNGYTTPKFKADDS